MYKKILAFILAYIILFSYTSINVMANNEEYDSILEKNEDAVYLLKNDTVFATSSDKCYIHGQKRDYAEYGQKPYINKKGITMVPTGLITNAFDISIKKNSDKTITIKNCVFTEGTATYKKDNNVFSLDSEIEVFDDEIYIPIASFCRNILDKYVYEDERGYILISDVDRNYSNNDDIITYNVQPVDIIQRYLFYDRPTSDELYHAVMTNSENVHPKMFFTENEIETLKNRIKTNDSYKASYNDFIHTCEKYISTPLTEYSKPDGLRLYEALATKAGGIIQSLGIAYQMTKDTRYAKRAWSEIENILSWKDWNCEDHFLDSGEAVPQIVVGFDCIYNYLSTEQIDLFKKRFQELYLDYCVGVFTGESKYKATSLGTSNWGAVCGAGMLYGAMCLINEEPENSELTKKCKFIASQSIQSFEITTGNLFPNGTTKEGFVYWEYYFSNICRVSNLLKRLAGSDFGLLSTPGFDKSVQTAFYYQTALGPYPYSDTSYSLGIYFPQTVFLYAYLMQDKELGDAGYKFLKQLNKKMDFTAGMWYNPNDFSDTALPLDYYAEGGDEITSMRSSWDDKNGMFLGAIGGKNTQMTSHFDKGSFIFEALGERWFVDLGSDNYNVTGSYWDYNTRLKLYRIRTEGHNNVVINPSLNDMGQELNKKASVIRYESKPKGAISVYDLKNVYDSKVSEYKRGFFMTDNRESMIIQDEIKLKSKSKLYWFLHTEADIEISDDGKSALLVQNGKKLKLKIYCNLSDWTLKVMNAEPLDGKVYVSGEYSREGFKKIALVSNNAIGDVTISAKAIPITESIDDMEFSVTPINEWSIPNGNINIASFTHKGPISDKISTDVQTFDEMSAGYASKTIDADLISDFSRKFGWTLTGNDVYMQRVTGASGKAGDYAVRIIPQGASNTNARLSLDGWTEEIKTGTVFIEFDFEFNPVSQGVLYMWGIPVDLYGCLIKENSSVIKGTDFEVENEKWVHMQYEYNIDNSTYTLKINGKTYIDNEKCVAKTGENKANHLYFEPQFWSGANYYTSRGWAHFTLDNFRIYKLSNQSVNDVNYFYGENEPLENMSTDIQTFDDIPDDYENGTDDSNLISDFSKNFGWTLTGNNIFLRRIKGASGKNGDYAILINPRGATNYSAKFKLNGWTEEVKTGNVTVEYDLFFNPAKQGVLNMKGIPFDGEYGCILAENSDIIKGTNFTVENEKWYHMCYEYNADENTCTLKIDGNVYWQNKKCEDKAGECRANQLYFEPLFWSTANWFTSNGYAYMALDNFRISKGIGEKYCAETNGSNIYIPKDATSIELCFKNEVDSSLIDETYLSVNDSERIKAKTAKHSRRSLQLYLPENLKNGDRICIDFGGAESIIINVKNSSFIQNGISAKFSNINFEAGVFSGEMFIDNPRNVSYGAAIIIAKYDRDNIHKLKACKIMNDVSINNGTNKFDLSIDCRLDSEIVRVFVFDSLNTLVPLCKSYTFDNN